MSEIDSTEPTPDETPEMFAMTYAGMLNAFDVCLVCGSLLAMGEGTKLLHRQWHERIEGGTE